jgi:Asp/Glu/hydantoin racemase
MRNRRGGAGTWDRGGLILEDNGPWSGRESDRVKSRRIIEPLVEEEGAQGVILGCTDIPLLIKQMDVSVPTCDSTRLHARAALEYALGADGDAIFP